MRHMPGPHGEVESPWGRACADAVLRPAVLRIVRQGPSGKGACRHARAIEQFAVRAQWVDGSIRHSDSHFICSLNCG